MTMGTCKDCKYWGTYYERACDRVGDMHTERTPDSSFEIEATALDDSGLEVQLLTGPDFGCVQFVQK